MRAIRKNVLSWLAFFTSTAGWMLLFHIKKNLPVPATGKPLIYKIITSAQAANAIDWTVGTEFCKLRDTFGARVLHSIAWSNTSILCKNRHLTFRNSKEKPTMKRWDLHFAVYGYGSPPCHLTRLRYFGGRYYRSLIYPVSYDLHDLLLYIRNLCQVGSARCTTTRI